MVRSRSAQLLVALVLATTSLVSAPVTGVPSAGTAQAASTYADPNFRETTIFSGLDHPMSVRFAADGRAFVAEKRGIIKAYDSITDQTPTTVIDLRTEVHDFWDRGMLGMELDPGFLGARPYLYLFYVRDAVPGGASPRWNDACPNPPGPLPPGDGCTVTGRLVRYQVNTGTNVASVASEKELLHDFCAQFPSHSGGAMTFDKDGQLILVGGDGADFINEDYGQNGGRLPNPGNPVTPINPCGDPLPNSAPPGQAPNIDPATAEGGSLRSQDLRTPGDPVGLAGAVVRINPDTGAASAGNPLIGSADPNAQRIVAYGLRNPFRLAKHPVSGDLYIGDVGWNRWEEINRVPASLSTVRNFGWPCYEGAFVTEPWDTLGNHVCDALYAENPNNQQPQTVTHPLYGYFHAGTNFPCGQSTGTNASISGLAFYDRDTAAGPYPARYDGALFFVDYSRDCFAMLRPGAGNIPDPGTWEVFATGIGNPVDLVVGPAGDLYYVDFDGGRVVRVRYSPSPVARGTATPAVSHAPVTVRLNASTSTDPDPTATLVAWDWDLDHDGVYGEPGVDLSGQVVDWEITDAAVYPITLRVTNSLGLTDTAELVVNAANDPPVPVIDTPSSSLTWSVGDQVQFSGSASDPDEGALAAEALTWTLIMHHCVGVTCHEHAIQSYEGVASGSFVAPDHAYPSFLELRLKATDGTGTSATTSVELQPQTTTLNVLSSPSGVPISVGSTSSATPSETTLLRGGTVSVTAPVTWTSGGSRYRFQAWSDGLAPSHAVTVTDPASRTATYVPDAPDSCATAKPVSAGAWTNEYASGRGDADWFRFSVPDRRRVVITLGNLPVDAALDLYASCSKALVSANVPGTRFERLTRSLPAGTYRVRVRIPSNAVGATRYALRVLTINDRLGIESAAVSRTSNTARVAGQIVNGTGRAVGRVQVTATFRDAQGRVVGTLRGRAFANRLANGAATPFLLTGRVTAYVTVSYRLDTLSAGPSRSLSLSSLALTTNANGTVTEAGRVRNGGSRATAVSAARAWYGRRGEVLDVKQATTTPSTLRRGGFGRFTIVRPALTGVQKAATFLRGN